MGYKLTTLLFSGVVLSACNGSQLHSNNSANQSYLPQGQSAPSYQVSAPIAPPYAAQPAPDYMAQAPVMFNQQAEGNSRNIVNLQQRLERLERAMVRLDRRMQLVESNELGRMGASINIENSDKIATKSNVGIRQISGQNNVPPMASPYPANFQPVSAVISSGLQAAPSQGYATNSQNMVSTATSSRLPSLADKSDNSNTANAAMTVWTIRYAAGKIWPDKSQLPSSKNVVSALRNGKPIALFARGSNPNSREFRERVRALGKYLSKVSDLENVAISTMTAQQLDSDTVEIFATE